MEYTAWWYIPVQKVTLGNKMYTAAVIVCLHNWNICLWHIKIIIHNCKKACHICRVSLCLSLQSKQFVDEGDSPAMCLVQILWTGTPRQVPLHLYPIQHRDMILTFPPLCACEQYTVTLSADLYKYVFVTTIWTPTKKENLSDPLKSS